MQVEQPRAPLKAGVNSGALEGIGMCVLSLFCNTIVLFINNLVVST